MANEEILELQIRDNAAVAAEGLSELTTSLLKVKEAIGKGLRLGGTVNALEKLKTAVTTGLTEESVARFERLASALEKLKSIGAVKITGLRNIANQMNGTEMIQDANQTMQGVQEAVDRGMEEIQSKAVDTSEAVNQSLHEFGDTTAQSRFQEIAGSIRASLLKISTVSFTGVKAAFTDLASSAKNVATTVGGMLGQFMRIAKYRFIRSVIKNITEAFSTGIKNVYFYSRAIKSDFAPAMDSAASSLAQMKNAIGAMTAPLLQSLIPALNSVVNAVIDAVNWVNQFIALLRGQKTWTKALPQTVKAFDETKKAAKGSSKAIKELLADWDELNIIQSESGGSGSGTAKAVEDYSKMFEEENQFDGWLSDHFQEVLDMIKMIGVALLAWKFSTKFSGLLGQLSRLVAGGAMVALGVTLSFTAGYDIGLNGANQSNVLMAILGTLATALGGFLIAGPYGAAIGLAVGIVVTLTGYISGKSALNDKMKWGNLTWTQDQIERFVRGQFSFSVTSEITIIDGEIANLTEAKKNLDQKISEFKNSLQDANIEASININSDETSDTVTNAATQGIEAIKAVNRLVEASGEGLNVVLKSFSFKDEEGNDITKELLKTVKIDNKTVESYFLGIGDEIAALIEQGEHEHWQNADTKQAVLDLLEREEKILNEAKRYKADYQLQTQITAGMSSVVDSDTAKKVMEEQKTVLDNYKTEAMTLFQEQADVYNELAGYAKAAAADAREIGTPEAIKNAEELEAVAQRYHELADTVLNGANDRIKEKLAETQETMRRAWVETLTTIYGGDFAQDVDEYKFDKALFDKTKLLSGNAGEAGEWLRNYFIEQFTLDDPNYIVDYVLNDLNGNVYDLFSNEMRKKLMDKLLETTGSKEQAEAIMDAAFGEGNYYQFYSEQYIQKVKESINDAIEKYGYLSDNAKSQIINMFGQEPFDAAMKELGLSGEMDVEMEVEVKPKLAYEFDENNVGSLYREINSLLSQAGLEGTDLFYDMAKELVKYNTQMDLDSLQKVYRYILENENGAFTWLDWIREQDISGANRSGMLARPNVVSTEPYYWSRGTSTEEESATEQTATNIETGVNNVNASLDAILLGINAIRNKQWTVNFTPSSTLGAMTGAAIGMYKKISGDG